MIENKRKEGEKKTENKKRKEKLPRKKEKKKEQQMRGKQRTKERKKKMRISPWCLSTRPTQKIDTISEILCQGQCRL